MMSEHETETSQEMTESDTSRERAESENQITQELDVDSGTFVDEDMFSRLQNSILKPAEVYHEAQIFSAQHFDVGGLLRSEEPILVRNTLEILRMVGQFHPEAIDCIVNMDDEGVKQSALRYVSACLQKGIISAENISDALILSAQNASDERLERIRLSAKLLSNDMIRMASRATGDDALILQMAVTRICPLLDDRTVSHMIFDPSPTVRIAVLRHLITRPQLDINDLSAVLIILKDKDEEVRIWAIKLLSKFKTLPEAVIAPVLAVLAEASDRLREEIHEMFRCYGNDAVESTIQALNDPSEKIEKSVAEVIAKAPIRFTDGLLHALFSVKTREIVRNRVINILKGHNDVSRRPEIMRAIKQIESDEIDLPEWKAPDLSGPQYVERAIDDDAFYHEILNDKQIASLAKTCTEEAILRLLTDASSFAQLNAIEIVKHRGQAGWDIVHALTVSMRSMDLNCAAAALDAYIIVEKDKDVAIQSIVDAISRCESDEVKKHIMQTIMNDVSIESALIRTFYKTPKRCSLMIIKILMNAPSKEILDLILHGLDRSQSVECIAETVTCLLKARFLAIPKETKAVLIDLVLNPVSFGQYGLLMRLNSMKYLKLLITKDEHREKDRQTIDGLYKIYNTCPNAELKTHAKLLLRQMGEDLSEDSEYDD